MNENPANSQKKHENKIDKTYFDHISFFAKHFCLPKQIKLVDYDSNRENKEIKENIQIVERAGPLDNMPIFRNINEVDFEDEVADPGDGLISVIRKLNVKIAICITVYSQQKDMLKKTLAGIIKNYQTFLEKANLYSHQIVVVIIFDGIQQMNNDKRSDKNMINLFRQFDLINGFRKKQYIIAKQKEQMLQDFDQEEDSKINEIQNFTDQMVFTEEEYEALEINLLENQYFRYKEMRELLFFADNIEKSKLNNTPIQYLPKIVRDAFLGRARQYLEYNGIDDITQDNNQLEKYVLQNLSKQKIDIMKLEALKDSVHLAKDYIKSRQNTGLLYQIGLPLKDSTEENAKMNVFTVVKYSNKGKLSSHLWFFQGFCTMLNPSVCILLDCGLEPKKDALFKMWSHIQTYKKTCGGVCGYMKLRKQSPYDEAGVKIQHEAESPITKVANFVVDIQKSQIFEYHFAHLLDKPFESLTGYIHVLPGAFSGYNWDALKGQKFKVMRSDGQVFEKDIQKRAKQEILKKYLKTVIYNQVLDDISEANMYLAEDRILCLQIYTRKKNKFCLDYLPNCQAVVDPIITLPKLLSQRKRWVNGSWFALDYVLKNRNRVSESTHNCWDKLWFHFNMINAEIMRLVAYLSLTFFFITLHLMVLEFSQTTLKNYFMDSYSLSQDQIVLAKIFNGFFSIRSVINNFIKVVDLLFIISIGIAVYRSLTIRKQDTTAKRSFNTIASWLGVFGIFSIVLVFINFFQAITDEQSNLINLDGIFTQRTFIYLLIGIVGAHLIVIISSFNCRTFYEIITSLPSYFFYVPSYINLFFIYAFCRIDDLSWGTKGLETQQKAKKNAIRIKFADEKIKFVLKWLGTNIVISLILAGIANNYDIQNYIIWIFSAYFALIMVIKALVVIIFFIQYNIFKRYKVNKKVKEIFKLNANGKILGDKKKFANFVHKIKEQYINQHLEHLNEELAHKQLLQQMRHENQENMEKDNGSKRRLSFRQLKMKNITEIH